MPSFANVVLPNTSVADMQGVSLLLDLIANPDRAAQARDLLHELAAKVDEAQGKLTGAESAQEAADLQAKKNAEWAARLKAQEQVLARERAEAEAIKTEYTRRLSIMKQWMADHR